MSNKYFFITHYMWNWEQKNWPNWEFNTSKFQEYEQKFLLTAAKMQGTWEYIDENQKSSLSIDLLADEALKNSEIEGEILRRDSVRSSIGRHFGLKTLHRSEPAEAGIAQMMVQIFQNPLQHMSHETLFQWHRYVCNGRTDIHEIGSYRSHREAMQVVSGQIDRPKVHFEAVPSEKVAQEMEIFIEWMSKNKLPALIQSAIAHLYFVSIHPFEDGNGRIARALSEHILSKHLGYPSLIALSYTIEKHRLEYYDMLEKNNKSLEIDSWISWFSDIILEAQEHSIQIIHFVIQKTKLLNKHKNSLNERQKKVILRLFDAGLEGSAGGLSAKNYISITKAPTSTTTRDLAGLVKKGVLKKTGERKSTRYFLNI